MSTIICPNCKFQNTEFDLKCFKCGHAFSPEEREMLLKENEMKHIHDSHKSSGEHPHEHKVQRKLNLISFGIFKVGFAEILVPIITFLLIIIVVFLMLMK